MSNGFPGLEVSFLHDEQTNHKEQEGNQKSRDSDGIKNKNLTQPVSQLAKNIGGFDGSVQHHACLRLVCLPVHEIGYKRACHQYRKYQQEEAKKYSNLGKPLGLRRFFSGVGCLLIFHIASGAKVNFLALKTNLKSSANEANWH